MTDYIYECGGAKAVVHVLLDDYHTACGQHPDYTSDKSSWYNEHEIDLEEHCTECFNSAEDLDRLSEIINEIKELAEESINIVRMNGANVDYHRARSYWYGQILSSLDKNHDFVGSSMCTLKDSMESLKESNAEEAKNRADEEENP